MAVLWINSDTGLFLCPQVGTSSKYSVVWISSTNVLFSANLLWIKGIVSVGNLTPRSSNWCRTLHSWPNSSGISSGSVSTIDVLLSLELASSLLGSLVCPSVSCCIQILGLHVAVTVGWDRDPSGKLILGLLVLLGSTSKVTGGVVAEVVVAMVVASISGTSTLSLSQTSVDGNWFPAGILTFLLSTAAKNWQVDANASSLLASFVPHMI